MSTQIQLWCSLLIAYNRVIPPNCYIFHEPMTPKQLFVQTGVVKSNREYKEKYHSLHIHWYTIEEYMEWDEYLFHTDNSILLYMGKRPTTNFVKVTFILN